MQVVAALRSAAFKLDLPHRTGVTHSKDSFFGETEKERMPMQFELARRWDNWVAGGAVCSEMESSTRESPFTANSVLRAVQVCFTRLAS